MKTEQQYAIELILKYIKIIESVSNYGDNEPEAIQCAIIDVTNTIEALDSLSHRVDAYVYDSLQYYKTVLTILKDKI